MADQQKYAAFGTAAQNMADAFSNADFTKYVQGQQLSGLNQGQFTDKNAIGLNPALQYNKENSLNWLQNSYNMLQDRLNLAGLR